MKELNAYDTLENKTEDILELLGSKEPSTEEKDLYLKALLIACIIDLKRTLLQVHH